MSDQDKKTGFTAEELRDSLSTFDPATVAGSESEGQGVRPDAGGKPELPGEQWAEEKRRKEQARPAAMPVRDDKIVHIGLAQSVPNKGGGRSGQSPNRGDD